MNSENDNITIQGLIKIGKREYIESLQKEGLIHCRTVEYFRQIERAARERKDSREGATSSLKITDLKIWRTDNKKEIPLKFTKVRLHTHDDELLHSHLYCLFMIKPEHVTGQNFIDKRNENFGDSFLIIHNPGEFLERFKRAAENKFKYSNGPVYYYDDEQNHSRLTIFHKPDSFKYQSEFRFHIKDNHPEPTEFKIGSIEDISIIMDCKHLTDLNLKPIDKE